MVKSLSAKTPSSQLWMLTRMAVKFPLIIPFVPVSSTVNLDILKRDATTLDVYPEEPDIV